MKITFLLIVLLSLFGGESSAPIDSECIAEPFFVWESEDHGWCNMSESPNGDLYLYACRIKKHSDYFGEYESFKFLHQCVYSATSSVQIQLSFLPLINNNPTITSSIRP